MTDDESPMPYAGLQVLDISQGIAGPYCAQIMWQQGADVIKVEPPSGDWGRAVGVVRGDNSALNCSDNALLSPRTTREPMPAGACCSNLHRAPMS